jgi:hypothetical protein
MVMTPASRAVAAARRSRTPLIALGGLPYRLSAALIVVAGLAAGLSYFATGALLGPAVSIGSLRGTALVVLVVAVPVAAAGMIAAARGSARGLVLWSGAAAYLLYNAVMFAFATPLNRFFLLYVALLGLALWSVVAVLRGTDLRSMAARVSPRLPARAIAAYTWLVVLLNAVAWLGRIVPALYRGEPQSLVEGTGVATNPVYVQDLAVWLPLAAVAAWWLWRRRPAGVLVVGAMLTMWVIESISIAVDQWFGHAADPGSPVASAVVTPVFAVVALLGLVPVAVLLGRVDTDDARQ